MKKSIIVIMLALMGQLSYSQRTLKVNRGVLGTATGTGTITTGTGDGGFTVGVANNGQIAIDSLAGGASIVAHVDSGTIRASNKGAFVSGYADNNAALMQASGQGSQVFGKASYSAAVNSFWPSQMIASGSGSMVSGYTSGGSMKASGQGAHIFGQAFTLGLLNSSSYASFISGYAQSSASVIGTTSINATGAASTVFGIASATSGLNPSTISATNNTTFVSGSASGGSTITASGLSSSIFGLAVTRSSLSATANGARVFGYTQIKGEITSSGNGSWAGGFSTDSLGDGSHSDIQSTNFASFAQGYSGWAGALSPGHIRSNGRASWATGWANGGGTIQAGSDGAYAGGVISGSGIIYSGGMGTYSFGYVNGTDSIYSTGNGSYLLGGKLYNTGNYSQIFGYGIRNTVNNVFKVGNGIDAFVYDGTAQTLTKGVPEYNKTLLNTDASKFLTTDASGKFILATPSGGGTAGPTYTASNGVIMADGLNDIQLGGNLNKNIYINNSTYTVNFTGTGTNARIKTDGDVEVTDPTKGIILTSPDSSRWRITVDNSGTLHTTKQ